jgi:hypothetical protein
MRSVCAVGGLLDLGVLRILRIFEVWIERFICLFY